MWVTLQMANKVNLNLILNLNLNLNLILNLNLNLNLRREIGRAVAESVFISDRQKVSFKNIFLFNFYWIVALRSTHSYRFLRNR